MLSVRYAGRPQLLICHVFQFLDGSSPENDNASPALRVKTAVSICNAEGYFIITDAHGAS